MTTVWEFFEDECPNLIEWTKVLYEVHDHVDRVVKMAPTQVSTAPQKVKLVAEEKAHREAEEMARLEAKMTSVRVTLMKTFFGKVKAI